MKHQITLYFSTFILMAALDFLWIGVLALKFYKTYIGTPIEFRVVPAVLFYIVYTVGILFFVSGRADISDWKTIAVHAAMFGFVAYCTYDLTNMATLKAWSWPITLVDICWGVVNTVISATGGWLIAQYIARA